MERLQKTRGEKSPGKQTPPAIYLFIEHFETAPLMKLWRGTADTAQTLGVNVFCFLGGALGTAGRLRDHGNVIYELLDEQRADGLLLDGTIGIWSHFEELRALCERYQSLPIVSIVTASESCPGIVSDNAQGIQELIGHLVDVHGYRRIGFIHGPQNSPEAKERYLAYIEALRIHDLPFDPVLVAPGDFRRRGGRMAIELLLDRRHVQVDALVAANDLSALGAIEALQSRGIRVPSEIAVVGFDDIEEGLFVTPSLTTVQQPFYDMGQRALDAVLAQIRGDNIPERVVLPTRLVVRQSCGCLSPEVLQAASIPATESFQSTSPAGSPAFMCLFPEGRAVDEFNRVFDFFTEAVSGASANTFFTNLEDVLSQNRLSPGNISRRMPHQHDGDADLRKELEAGDISYWQNVISRLHGYSLSAFRDEQKSRAEILCQQARIIVGETAQRIQGAQKLRVEQQAQLLRQIGARLTSTFDISQLTDVLAEELPRLEILSCYLALYEDPHPYHYPQSAPEWSRLILAYSEQGRQTLPPDGYHFLSRQIVPEEFLVRERTCQMVVVPLYFQEQQIGFIVLETNAHRGDIYEALLTELSAALQGALLVQQVQAHAAELSRKQYILDTFLDTVPDAIYFKDRNSRITQANKAHAIGLGLRDPAEEIGKSDFDFFPEHQAQIKYAQEQEIMRTCRPLIGVEELNGERWMLTTKMPLQDEYGEIIGTFGISRDITSLKHSEQELRRHRAHLAERVEERTAALRKTIDEMQALNARLQQEIAERSRAEQALRIGEQQYRMLAENVMDGIAIVQDANLMFMNAALAAMVGRSKEELLSNPAIAIFHERSRQKAHEQMHRSQVNDSESRWQAELLSSLGQTLWVEIDRAFIEWNGMPAILLTFRDISERKVRESWLEQERTRLEQENVTLRSTIAERYRFGQIVGKSPSMQFVYELILSAASSDVNVLVGGESGTGKELIARTIHQLSSRKDQAFVAVNCASIPDTLFEREFFGHSRGSFTGADRARIGFFDRAHKGILFLDEVTELTPGMQAKLLRVLQDGHYTPLGSTLSKQADVLIVAATNKKWKALVQQGLLREDFLYRIGILEIEIPPLRERREDLPLLIDHLLEQYRQRQARLHNTLRQDLPTDQTMLPSELLRALYSYSWPGNVRELQNILQRYLATRRLDLVLSHFDSSNTAGDRESRSIVRQGTTLTEALTFVEKQLIAETLSHNRQKTKPSAEQLGITQRTLQRKIKQYGLNMENK